MTGIRTKPLDEVIWQDIELLGASGAAEDAMLEFKGLLPEKNGRDHPWYAGRDVMTDHTRDELAAEVVAFANAYGGRLIIGIAETQDRPRKATGTAPLPRCGKFAEQFEQALRSLVDPPIGGLQIKAIVDPTSEDAGAVVIAVPASDLAPHGIGRPPAAYVRRGTSCEQMTMRDLQSVFWDARTKQQRIDAIRSKSIERLRKLRLAISNKGLPATERHVEVKKGQDGLFVRMQAIPHQSLELGHLPIADPWLLDICPEEWKFRANTASVFNRAPGRYGWNAIAHGVASAQEGPCNWSIHEDGTVSLIGFNSPADHLHYPGWYTVPVAMLLVMSERLRRWSGRPDIPIEIDLEFIHEGKVIPDIGRGSRHFGPPETEFEVGPYLLQSRSEIPKVFDALERQIWAGFSIPFVQAKSINFDGVLSNDSWVHTRTA